MFMTLKLLVPFTVFSEQTDVRSIVAESSQGSFGLLEHRRDCAVILAPGILTCESVSGEQSYFATDTGVLVKTGTSVVVSVRRAIGGSDLSQLRDAVASEFLMISEQEQSVRMVVARLESSFLHRLMRFGHE